MYLYVVIYMLHINYCSFVRMLIAVYYFDLIYCLVLLLSLCTFSIYYMYVCVYVCMCAINIYTPLYSVHIITSSTSGDQSDVVQFGGVPTSASSQHGPQPDMDCSTNICTLCIPKYSIPAVTSDQFSSWFC